LVNSKEKSIGMTKDTAIRIFNEKQIRSHWDNDQEKWYFSIVDVVGVLTESENPNNYWKVLKNRLKNYVIIANIFFTCQKKHKRKCKKIFL